MRHIPPAQLYNSLYARLNALWPTEVDSRVTNMVYLMWGIFLGRTVQTGRLASKIPRRGKRMSIVRRLERFLSNTAIHARVWYEPTAGGLIAGGGQQRAACTHY